MMNPELERLYPYPFERLSHLLEGVTPAAKPAIRLSIGEPRHPTPALIGQAITKHLESLAIYPVTRGEHALREAITQWLIRRFDLPKASLDPGRHVLPVNGTREALFAFAQAVVNRTLNPLVLMPNPFYQIYEGAARLAGAETAYINCTAASGFAPDFAGVAEATWRRCQLLYICTPGNPTGTVLDEARLQWLIEQAERFDFVIASDECYSELYVDEDHPPPGLLGAAVRMGNTEYRRCVVFHSLSKRSNAPGLRSGFVAGDAEILKRFYRYRVYHGCAMPPPIQAASRQAWADETHVIENRRLYREKFAQVLNLLASHLEVGSPDGGFYLWPRVPMDDQAFARELYRQQHVTVLPGSFLGRDTQTGNPGQSHVRMALVAPLDECIEAAQRMRHFLQTL